MDVQEDPAAVQEFHEMEHRLYLEQLHDALESAMKTLPDADRGVLVARYYQGRTRREIGPHARQEEEKALASLRRSTVGLQLWQFVQGRAQYPPTAGVRAFGAGCALPVKRANLERERLELQKEVFGGKEPVE